MAIVPAGGSDTPLSALYPRVLGECLWGRGAVWELLQRLPAEIDLTVAVSGKPPAIILAPEARVKVRAGLVPGMAKSADLEPAANLVSSYWTGFCSKAAPFFVSGGISKLVVSGSRSAGAILPSGRVG